MFFCNTQAQIEDSVSVSQPLTTWAKNSLRIVGKESKPQRDEILRQLDWQWQCLGPNVLPAELNPGGRAIPAYAVNRGNGTGRINFLFQHPVDSNYIWACSPTGGVWISPNRGEKWHNAGTDALPISGVAAIAVDPNCVSKWVIATGDGDDLLMYSDGVWITNNCGQSYEKLNGTWEHYTLPYGDPLDNNGQISDVVAEPRHMDYLLVAGNRGLFMSKGNVMPETIRWNAVAAGRFYDVLIIPSEKKNKDIIAAAGDRLVISFDGGKEWTEMPAPEYPQPNEFPFLRISLTHSPARPHVLLAAVTCSESASQSGIGEATLQEFNLITRKWSNIRSLRKDLNNVIPTRARAFCASPADSLTLFCANVQPIFKSTDGGISFGKADKNQLHDDCHFLMVEKNGSHIWAATDGGVSRSTDGGKTWAPRDLGIGAANVFGLSTAQTIRPQVAFGAYDTGGNLLRDGSWWHVNWGDGFETISHPADSAIAFTTLQNGGIFRTTNRDDFNTVVTAVGQKSEWHTWIRQHPVHHNMIVSSGKKCMRSMNLGDQWELLFEAEKLDSNLVNTYRFFFSENHPGVMYAYVLDKSHIRPQIWRTFQITEPDATAIRWEKVTDMPVPGWIMNIEVDPADPRNFWLLLGRTENTGKFWYFNGEEYADQTLNLGSAKCESMVLQRGADKRLYLGSNYGVFTKSAKESQWTLLKGLPGTAIKSLAINYTANKLMVGSFGRGVWMGELMRK